MCGLFAYVGDQSDDEQVKASILEAAKRGVHSWGYVAYREGVKMKRMFNGMPTDETLDDLSFADNNLIIGHLRLATTGGYDIEDAQPIDNNRYAVVHNGTVRDYQDVYDELAYSPRTGNDSEAVLAIMTAGKIEDVIALLKNSHYAVMVYDGLEETFYASRNYHPLWLRVRSNGIYICSRKVNDDYFKMNERTIFSRRVK